MKKPLRNKTIVCFATAEPRLSGFLNYPDFFSSSNFAMKIKIRCSIMFKTYVQSKGVCFAFLKAKAALTRVVTKEEHTNEF